MTVMVQVVLGPWLNKKCDKTISTAWNDNIALGYETEARDRESKETLDRIHEQQLEQKPRVQGRASGVRRRMTARGTQEYQAGIRGERYSGISLVARDTGIPCDPGGNARFSASCMRWRSCCFCRGWKLV